ncbi:GLPGLI family protein [Chryseobacterium piscicola]|jgi:GLPGLI family protein|uniref:GLPGLI family protein n=2 Tax=Chryseobacterium group TaxID=2782232 RepID=A0A1N7KHA3_9FLAO|nr:hypothetical protein B0A70_03970 [Chryseobacterium piscicola]SIS60965.1 GLPGLI family protein [Chryseobacterium piscicola]
MAGINVAKNLLTLIMSLCIYVSSLCQDVKTFEVDYLLSRKSTKIDSSKVHEIFKLFVNEDHSIFISKRKIENDSIRENLKMTKGFGTSNNISLYSFEETVLYKYPDNQVSLYMHIPHSPIGYNEKAPLDWKLLNDTKLVNNIVLNSAEIVFGGRKWHAWYSKEYSINEGPYKFKNLPGLIFEIYDAEKIFSFKLIKIKNSNSVFNYNYKMFLITSKDKCLDVVDTYINNPAPQLTKIFTQESRDRIKKNSIERNKNKYHIEKDFEY